MTLIHRNTTIFTARLLFIIAALCVSLSVATVRCYAHDMTIPVCWCKETTTGAVTKSSELRDSEAMWWDDNQKAKDSIRIPYDHSVAVSSSEGAVLWTPYALPKKKDTAVGMPLMAYAFYYGDSEIARCDVEDRHTVYLQAVDRSYAGGYPVEPGIRVADNAKMTNAVLVNIPARGYEDQPYELSLHIIYRGRSSGNVAHVKNGDQENGTTQIRNSEDGSSQSTDAQDGSSQTENSGELSSQTENSGEVQSQEEAATDDREGLSQENGGTSGAQSGVSSIPGTFKSGLPFAIILAAGILVILTGRRPPE